MTKRGSTIPKTPDKSLDLLNSSFSPSGKSSPNREVPGPASTAYKHTCIFRSHIQQWKSLHKKGLLLCRTIQALRLHEIIGQEYPGQLSPLCESLLEATQAMHHVAEDMQTLLKQVDALSKLHTSFEPIVNTWSATKLAEHIRKCIEMFSKEMKSKQIVTENIAHCRDENLMEVYVSLWEYNLSIDDMAVALVEAEISISYNVLKL